MAGSSILITGASTGIGEACALHFDRLGWDVFAGVRRPEDGDRLKERAGDRLRPVLLDVTDPASIDVAVKEIGACVGQSGLTAVVNNAGIAVGGPIEYLPLEQWRHQFEVNVIAQVGVTQAVMPLIRQSASGGRVVFIGSIGGRMASPMIGPYAASKHAIEAIAESMRHELFGSRIQVVVVEPGAVATPIWEKARSTANELESNLSPEAVERYRQGIAVAKKAIEFQARSGVEPEVVARVVERAVTSARPAPRYLVGRDAKAMALVARFLPDRARDAVQRSAMKLIGPAHD
jgi:NAD(P)-dependent dehydrogenase (short-subunit alcohol dehydrogenase family)